MTLIPHPRFMPDRSRLGPSASIYINNARPTTDGWGPLKMLVALSDPLPEEFRGGVAVLTDGGTWQIYAGGPNNLYQLDTTAYSWNEISRLTDDYNLADGFYRDWEVFGNRLIATAKGSTFPQYKDLSGISDFANLPNADFEAELVWTAGDFLCCGRVDNNKRLVKWSGVNDTESWTIGERGSDEQELPDGGPVMRGIKQNLNSLVIQESCIRRMQFTPESPVPFRFDILNPSTGAIASRSVVNIGPDDFVYLRQDGFFRGIQARPIGAEKIDRWFFGEVDQSQIDLVSAVADPFDKIVWFRYPVSSSINRMLGYHWQLDEWFPSDQNVVGLLAAATPGYSLDDLNAFGTMDTLPYSLDSRFWKGGIRGFAGFNSSYEFGFFDGDNLEAIIESPELQLNYPRRAILDRIGVQIDTTDFSVAVASRETLSESLTYGAYAAPETGTQWVSNQASGRYHRIRTKIAAGAVWKQTVGIDPIFTDGGKW